jgi:hypothetical protein
VTHGFFSGHWDFAYKSVFYFAFTSFFSCKQSNSKFKLQHSFQVGPQKSICISTKDCFCFSADSNLYHLIMYYSNVKCENKKLIDSVEFSPYKSTLHSFKSQNGSSFIILWETEYEYYPLIQAYYITGGKLVKIGKLDISLPCQSCESFEYPIKDIQILQKGKDFEFSFLENVNYKPEDNTDWQLYKSGSLKIIFNTETNELRSISSSE